jgi:hypothetical protein
MGQIIQFPKMPKGRGRAAPDRDAPHIRQPWRRLWEHPVTEFLYSIFVILIFCTWPLLRWLVVADVLVQLLRMVFVGGLATVVALTHFFVIGAVAYLVWYVPPPSQR